MKNSQLIELYGRRFTPLAKIAAFVAIAIIGILLAFSQGNRHPVNVGNPAVEQPIAD